MCLICGLKYACILLKDMLFYVFLIYRYFFSALNLFLLLFFPLEIKHPHCHVYISSLCIPLVHCLAQWVKNLLVVQETQVWSLGQEDLLEEGMANPLWYSCLENPMDRGAWWTIVYGVAKSWTRLK